MPGLHDLVQNPDAFVALEPEELALLVLHEIAAMEKRAAPINRFNFCQRFKNSPKAVKQALMEAWGWLESSGCIAQQPDSSDGWFFVTRRGQELARSADTIVYTREQLLPRRVLHPRIEQKIWSAFLRGEYDSAVFAAFKEVEVSIREAGGFGDTDIGVALARAAFHPATGPLTDMTVVPAERQALSDLFAGALGSYKNPHSHRNVTIKDASEAAEVIVLASHLLKIVDSRRKASKQ